jgi:hypothetical protein
MEMERKLEMGRNMEIGREMEMGRYMGKWRMEMRLVEREMEMGGMRR